MVPFSGKSFPIQILRNVIYLDFKEYLCIYESVCVNAEWFVTKFFFTVHSGQKSLRAISLVGKPNSLISSQGMSHHRKLEPLNDLFPYVICDPDETCFIAVGIAC